MVTDLMCIQLLAVWLVDVIGYWKTLTACLRWLVVRQYKPLQSLRPFSCSLCTTFWAGLVWLLIHNAVTLPLLVWLAVLCTLTPVTSNLLFGIRDILNKIINRIC